jgi:hypothetical protein
VEKFIILITHDRQTDDVIEVFQYSQQNVEKVKKLCQNKWKNGKELNYFGKYDYGWGEDYHSYFVIKDISLI